MNIEELFQSYLEKGWRVHLKTHPVRLSWISEEERHKFEKVKEDSQHGIGWACDAYSFGATRDAIEFQGDGATHFSGAVSPTIAEAINYTIERVEKSRNKLNHPGLVPCLDCDELIVIHQEDGQHMRCSDSRCGRDADDEHYS